MDVSAIVGESPSVMTEVEITNFRSTLAACYKCSPEEIDYSFDRIVHEDASGIRVDTDTIWLVYRLLHSGGEPDRVIFRMKVPVFDHVKKRYEELVAEGAVDGVTI